MEIRRIREEHPKLGCRKLQVKLSAFLQQQEIKIGRDALFSLLLRNGLLIRKSKKYHQTTMSRHWLFKYPNLIKNFIPTAPNQLWVSDITYLKVGDKHFYISLITDSYSHKIVGYHVALSLKSCETIKALKMALRELGSSFQSHFQLIHHSDRGVQYCEKEYVKLLNDKNILISMTENGDPRENAVAERVNGIVKNEYLFDCKEITFNKLQKRLKKSVLLYNKERPHMSIGNLVPDAVHYGQVFHKKLWKNRYEKKLLL